MRPGQQDLIHWMQRVSFTNTTNQCYFNAALAAWVWSHLCLKEWRPFFLGDSSNKLLSELCDLPATFDWGTSTWLEPLLRRFGLLGSQQDAAEFTQMLMGFTSATHLTQLWEKRSVDSGIMVQEQFNHMDLIRLNFPDDPFAADQDLTLNDLFDHWAQDTPPRSALTTQPGLMCIHLSRFTSLEDQSLFRIHKTVQAMLGVQVPYFVDSHTLDRDWQGMEVVAMISHLGEDASSGHYRAALRCRHDCQDHMWLLLDDNKPPEMMQNLPRWFQQQVTIMWLCSPRLLHLPLSKKEPTTPANDLELPELPAAWRLSSPEPDQHEEDGINT